MLLVEMLSQPFMQRAFAAGAMCALLLAALGIFVTLRKMAYFGDGIAHATLAGIAIAVVAGVAPIPVALVWGVLVAAFIFWFERATRLSSDTLIGIALTASMALGVVLINLKRGYQPELLAYLFGSILAITLTDLAIIAAISVLILGWLALSFRQLTYMSLAEESAIAAGLPTRLQTFILYVALALATVASVKVLGIILVSALLILPPATSRLLTGTFRTYLVASLLLAETFVLTGLALSYAYDLPSGATIILVGTTVFFLAAALRRRSA
jgi:ABC-type Mn2+/Zn2+ transport system permease subunit